MITVLINKKTGQELPVPNAEEILKQYPNTFKVKPPTTLEDEVLLKDEQIKTLKDIEVNEEVDVNLYQMKRAELNEIAIKKALNPKNYKNKTLLIEAIINS